MYTIPMTYNEARICLSALQQVKEHTNEKSHYWEAMHSMIDKLEMIVEQR